MSIATKLNVEDYERQLQLLEIKNLETEILAIAKELSLKPSELDITKTDILRTLTSTMFVKTTEFLKKPHERLNNK